MKIPSLSPPEPERPPANVNPLPKSYAAARVAELELSGEPVKSEPPPKPAAVPEPQLLSKSVKALYTQDVE